jgi:predicted TIM-barrel fold metal-dependent hydrolase
MRRPRRLAAALAALVLVLGGTAGCRRRPPAPGGGATASQPGSLEEQAARRFAHIPKIDYHAHITRPDALKRALELGRPWGIVHYVNLSVPPKAVAIEAYVVAGRLAGDRKTAVVNLPWVETQNGPGYGARMAAALVRANALGVKGVKISKGLGLGYVGPDRRLLAVDDPELDVVFEKAGELGLPVSIHVGDPKAFWQPTTPANERYAELKAHPDWSNFGEPVPAWEELVAAFERRVARHPRTRIVGVHFGNAPEEPARVAAMLDKYPNYSIDLAARIPEIGRRDPADMRRFFIKYQDRILFGTDLGVGVEEDALMFGSTGADPPTKEEGRRFFEATWRYLETDDHDFDHPTPIQGDWKISGIKLPREVLEKIYHRNAEKLLGIPEVRWP